MKSIVLALALSVASALDHQTWAQAHGKTYASNEETRYRENVWNKNLAFVAAHNEEFAHGRASFTVEMNKFADLTSDEFGALYRRPRATRSALSATGVFTAPLNETVAASYDWRTVKNVVGPVKDQGQCGSCWAFSAVAAMEGAYNYKSGTLNSFSEQELVDCTNNGHYTCNLGGEMSDGITEIVSNHGGVISTEAAYPYTAKSKFIKSCGADDSTGVKTGITGFTAVAEGDETALKAASAQQTIVAVGMDASANAFQLYSSGVYAPATCSSTSLDHGVAVVGYDTMTQGGDYWIVRNSWGESWGQDGYVYIARNDNNKCGLATDAVFANI